jgi:hypothetical protein
MSLLSLIQTGLSEREWENLWAKLVSSPQFQVAALATGFEQWKADVIAEGKNRQFIEYAYSGKRISLKKGIAQVVREMKQDAEPTV